MEKLMKPAEYAKSLGISRQAVYAKIKKGILSSKNVEGKLYIVIKDEVLSTPSVSTPRNATTPAQAKEFSVKKDYKALLQAKDETIAVLKETVVDLKESNKQISTTLRGEIDLLKDAFHEMRTLYVRQLEHRVEESKKEVDDEVIEIVSHEEKVASNAASEWIGVKKFFKYHKIEKKKRQEKLLKRLKKVYKHGDERFTKIEDKLKMNINKNYEDILN